MREKILVLGATGSIGRQCLDILKYSFDYEVVGLSLNSRIEVLEEYLPYFDGLVYVAIKDEEKARQFHRLHPHYHVLSGEECNTRLIESLPEASVFNSLMGNAGLAPTLKAIEENRTLFLSNKESIVIGSSLMEKALIHSTTHLYPVDSEHVGLAKLLDKARKMGIEKDIDTLYITASGGALRDLSLEELDKVTPARVLSHPTWSMGSKITVDSATMVNKGFEKIEASFLFHYPLDRIQAVICRESLVHALLSYRKDGETHYLYEYSPCDMKVAIAYALSKGTLEVHRNSPEDEENVRKLHFGKIDPSFYPLFETTTQVYEKYGNIGMILYNAVDTLAISEFLHGHLDFLGIQRALKLVNKKLSGISLELSLENLDSIERRLEEEAKTIVDAVLK